MKLPRIIQSTLRECWKQYLLDESISEGSLSLPAFGPDGTERLYRRLTPEQRKELEQPSINLSPSEQALGKKERAALVKARLHEKRVQVLMRTLR